MFKTLFELPRAVWLLGLVSLCNDTASELVYPLAPALSRLGADGEATGAGPHRRRRRGDREPAQAVLRGVDRPDAIH